MAKLDIWDLFFLVGQPDHFVIAGGSFSCWGLADAGKSVDEGPPQQCWGWASPAQQCGAITTPRITALAVGDVVSTGPATHPAFRV